MNRSILRQSLHSCKYWGGASIFMISSFARTYMNSALARRDTVLTSSVALQGLSAHTPYGERLAVRPSAGGYNQETGNVTRSRPMWVLTHNHASAFTQLRLRVVVLPSESRRSAAPPSTIPIPEVWGVEGNNVTLTTGEHRFFSDRSPPLTIP